MSLTISALHRYLACILLLSSAALCGPEAKAAPEQPSTEADEVPTEEAKAEAAKRYGQGVEAYKSELYSDAIILFLEADSLAPSPALSFNIARAYDKIQDVAGALKYYRDYLRRVPGAADQAAVKKLVSEREAQLAERGLQQFTVLTSPSGATVLLNGEPMGVSPWTGEIAPGTHELALRLRGFQDTELKIELAQARSSEVNLRLVPGGSSRKRPKAEPVRPTVAPLPPPPLDTKLPQAQGLDLGLWPWVALGASAATLAASGAFEWLRRDTEEDARNSPVQVDFVRRYDRMEQQQLTSRVLLGVGGGLAIVSGALFLIDSGGNAEPLATAPKLSASCNLSGCQALAKGAF